MYPSKIQYKNAVINEMFPAEQNGGYMFQPVLLNDEPVSSSGGNAIVFKVMDGAGKEYALKLFSEEIEGRFQRLKTISSYLENTDFKFLTDFKFIQNLIYVEMPGVAEEQCYFPGVVMKWIKGDTLDVKIKELINAGKKNEIELIAEKFKIICNSLLKKGIAHGDLKLSNILVNEKLELFLIDYDGMFLSELSGQRAMENGTASYQHPKRSGNHFDETIDHFSILNIYTSLLILAEEPAIFDKYNDGDNIIFVKEDFDDHENSVLFKELANRKVQPRLLYYLVKSLQGDFIGISNIKDLINGKFPIPKIEITHSPKKPVFGQAVNVSWNSYNVDFVMINGNMHDLNGSFELIVDKNHQLTFEFGTSLDTDSIKYLIEAKKPPKVIGFMASNQDLKFDEPLILSWKIENAKQVVLRYNNEEIDVTHISEYTISRLKADTIFKLILKAKISDFKVTEELPIRVFYPVKLNVKQTKTITFPNRPVKILIQSENAEQIILKPTNIDLLGKNSYELSTAERLPYQIIASNKRYIEVFDSVIEVLRAPSFERRVIEVPPINLSLPHLSIRIPTIKETLDNVGSFDRKILQVNRFLKKINPFKIYLNKTQHGRTS
ncbi:hypothetical protein BH10BAC2_BH10BAC2_02300 [soil metagenome]